ncbi:GreA/GreB family elongation factor [Candidatus Shapirobacteria bacterium]|nr:GreA/GreB family elongation factor [Candidatus Shapirobacteria bacterium]
MDKKILTPEGFRDLQGKLNQLRKKRPAILDRLEHARSMGDLAENSEYTQAKQDLEFLDHQIDELEEKIIQSRVVGNEAQNGQVKIGSQVEMILGQKPIVLSVVGDDEGNPLAAKISYSSPLGQALLGKKAGQEVVLKTPAGEELVYQIKKVS